MMNGKLNAICLTIFMTILLPAGLLAQAQPYTGGLRTRPLVTDLVDDTKLVRLSGNTSSAASASNDRGAVPDSFPMEHMWLQLQRPAELEQELVNLIEEMNQPGSPNFHQWLTAEEFGSRFGVSQQDIAKISDWLTSHGFEIDSVLPSGMVIEFSGNAGQVRDAFHTEIHNLNVNGESHIANMSDPQIPAALAGAVKGVVSLHNFMPHTNFKKRSQFTVVTVQYGTFYAVAPGDLATIYNLRPLFAAGYTGAGQTIAVIEDTMLKNASDVATFRSAFGLSGGSFRQENPTGRTTCTNPGVNGDEVEAALDAEWSGAAAPGAAIVLAACNDTTTVFGGLIAVQNLINSASPPQIMSISYGLCESENGSAANASYVTAYQQAAAEGVSVFVSAGDEGAASCDADEPVATHGIAVSGLASTPYNVAVGGTDFGDLYDNLEGGPAETTYWNSSNSSTFASAKSYMPEIPWNDSCASQLIYKVEGFAQGYGPTGFCNSTTGADFVTTSAGSGGPSSYSAKPSWQSVLGNPADGYRDLPDVSLFAGNGVWGHFFVFCLSDTAEGGVPCNYTNTTDILDLAAGGTSFSSPIMAGILALVNQKTGSRQGNPNPRLYALAAAEYGTTGSTACNSSGGTPAAPILPAASCIFNDVTRGDNDVDCTGRRDCYGYSVSGETTYDGVLSTSSEVLRPAYLSNTGWDFATGIGTLNAYNLVINWCIEWCSGVGQE
jgi:subtilase family serine protease